MYQAARPPLRRMMVIDQAVAAGLAQLHDPGPTTGSQPSGRSAAISRICVINCGANSIRPSTNGYHYTEPTFRLPLSPAHPGGAYLALPGRAADEAVGGDAVRVGLAAGD